MVLVAVLPEDEELDVLHWFDRTALEGLQIHTRYLRDLVSRHARTLPLRYIYNVDVTCAGAFFRLTEDDGPDQCPGCDPSLPRPWLEKIFHRVDNAFIRHLEFAFHREDLPALNYLRTNADTLQCRVKAVRIADTSHFLEIDYALVDFLGVHLKPEIYETSITSYTSSISRPEQEERYAMLFAHNALRGKIKHLVYKISCTMPNCIVHGLFGVDVVETCAVRTLKDPRPRIGEFIKTVERGTDVVRSVTLLHTPLSSDPPLRPIAELLGQPRLTNVPTPRSVIIDEFLRKESLTDAESTAAELFVFENAKAAKNLEVFVWTVELRGLYIPCLNYVFLLQVVDV